MASYEVKRSATIDAAPQAVYGKIVDLRKWESWSPWEGVDPEMTKRIVEAIKPLGFRYVALDLEGYRMGSLNEVLQIQREPQR